MAKKVKFTCAKCGAVHLVSRGEDGEVEVELEEKEKPKPKKKRDDIFSFITGDTEGEDDGEE